MLAPISWLKDFVDINIPVKDLMWRLTEVGLTCEKVQEIDGDEVLELEITPNRPDCMSIIGIAREIGAIQNVPLKHRGEIPNEENYLKPEASLPSINFDIDYELFERWSAIVIANVTIKPSPDWMQKRLKLINLRPINNVVDITNYVMFELGLPLHAFDYDEIKGRKMSVDRAAGGEEFTTVDKLTYKLPKDAMIIRDSERIIDLVGIKGGLNSGIKETTKNVLLHVTVDNPVLIRRTSQALSLRSDASAIYERGVDKGGTVQALKRATYFIVELSGGQVANDVVDLKKKEFRPWIVNVSHEQLIETLGVEIEPGKAKELLERLQLQTEIKDGPILSATVPTYRNDIKIPQDIIEEVARLYGYNNFPKTLPKGAIPTEEVAYRKDYHLENAVKQLLWAAGGSEVYTYSLISSQQLENMGIDLAGVIKVQNPVSREFEYLRPTLIGNLLEALKLNEPLRKPIQLFELGKVYMVAKGESYNLTLGFLNVDFPFAKGVVEELFDRLGIEAEYVPSRDIGQGKIFHGHSGLRITSGKKIIGVLGEVNLKTLTKFQLKSKIIIADLLLSEMNKYVRGKKIYQPIPDNPPIIEDLSFEFPQKTYIGEVIQTIKSIDPTIYRIEVIDHFDQSYAFRIHYLHPDRTLTSTEVATVRETVVGAVEERFQAKIKR